jgi:hypothetical protein
LTFFLVLFTRVEAKCIKFVMDVQHETCTGLNIVFCMCDTYLCIRRKCIRRTAFESPLVENVFDLICVNIVPSIVILASTNLYLC